MARSRSSPQTSTTNRSAMWKSLSTLAKEIGETVAPVMEEVGDALKRDDDGDDGDDRDEDDKLEDEEREDVGGMDLDDDGGAYDPFDDHRPHEGAGSVANAATSGKPRASSSSSNVVAAAAPKLVNFARDTFTRTLLPVMGEIREALQEVNEEEEGTAAASSTSKNEEVELAETDAREVERTREEIDALREEKEHIQRKLRDMEDELRRKDKAIEVAETRAETVSRERAEVLVEVEALRGAVSRTNAQMKAMEKEIIESRTKATTSTTTIISETVSAISADDLRAVMERLDLKMRAGEEEEQSMRETLQKYLDLRRDGDELDLGRLLSKTEESKTAVVLSDTSSSALEEEIKRLKRSLEEATERENKMKREHEELISKQQTTKAELATRLREAESKIDILVKERDELKANFAEEANTRTASLEVQLSETRERLAARERRIAEMECDSSAAVEEAKRKISEAETSRVAERETARERSERLLHELEQREARARELEKRVEEAESRVARLTMVNEELLRSNEELNALVKGAEANATGETARLERETSTLREELAEARAAERAAVTSREEAVAKAKEEEARGAALRVTASELRQSLDASESALAATREDLGRAHARIAALEGEAETTKKTLARLAQELEMVETNHRTRVAGMMRDHERMLDEATGRARDANERATTAEDAAAKWKALAGESSAKIKSLENQLAAQTVADAGGRAKDSKPSTTSDPSSRRGDEINKSEEDDDPAAMIPKRLVTDLVLAFVRRGDTLERRAELIGTMGRVLGWDEATRRRAEGRGGDDGDGARSSFSAPGGNRAGAVLGRGVRMVLDAAMVDAPEYGINTAEQAEKVLEKKSFGDVLSDFLEQEIGRGSSVSSGDTSTTTV